MDVDVGPFLGPSLWIATCVRVLIACCLNQIKIYQHGAGGGQSCGRLVDLEVREQIVSQRKPQVTVE